MLAANSPASARRLNSMICSVVWYLRPPMLWLGPIQPLRSHRQCVLGAMLSSRQNTRTATRPELVGCAGCEPCTVQVFDCMADHCSTPAG